MLKKPASVVLASFRPSTYPRGYGLGPSLAAALLDSLFEHPAGYWVSCVPQQYFLNPLAPFPTDIVARLLHVN
jgi:hypothetical protein